MSKGSSISKDIKNQLDNPIGEPLHGDCLTYAIVIAETYGGDNIFCVYTPDKENMDSIHAAAIIGDDIYDMRGKTTKNKLIGEQIHTMRRKYEKYILKNDINNEVVRHLNRESEEISLENAKDHKMFDRDLYNILSSNFN